MQKFILKKSHFHCSLDTCRLRVSGWRAVARRVIYAAESSSVNLFPVFQCARDTIRKKDRRAYAERMIVNNTIAEFLTE